MGYVNVSGTWRNIANYFVNVSGTWRSVAAGYVNISGTWRQFFTSVLTPSIASTVTISRNNATYPSTLTGTNYYWTNSTSLTYVFQKSSDNVNFTNIGSATSIANPSSGASNTVTYALTLPDFPAFTSYYRFVVTAVNSTYSTSATSTSTSVSVSRPAPINTVQPTITPSSGTAGVTLYSVNSDGTWDPVDADGVYDYLWQSYDTPSYISAPGTNTLSTYTPPSNFLTLGYLSPIRCRVTATNASGSTAAFSSNTATVSAPVVIPSGGTVSISTNTGNYVVGSIITYSTTGWANTPTSYSLRLYNGTNPVLTSDPLRASTSSTSGTYTIVSGDVPNYFKAFATASNSAGTSTEASSTQQGPAVAAPTAPSAPSPSVTSGPTQTTATVSWSAPANGGSAITSYEAQLGSYGYVNIGNVLSSSISGLTASTSYTYYVRAINAIGTSPAGSVSFTTLAAPVPSGGTVSLSPSGSQYEGVTLTASTTSWSGSPSSYSVRIYADTSNPPTTGSVLKASSGGASSVTYAITTFDASAPAFYFKAFATATNSGGTSTEEPGSNVVLSVAKTVPGIVTSFTATSLLSGTTLSWNATWSAPSSNGGATITSYKVFVERGPSSTGPWSAATTSISTTSGGTYSGAYTAISPYSTVNATTPKTIYGRVTSTSSTWIRVYVAAVNSVGTGSTDTAVG